MYQAIASIVVALAAACSASNSEVSYTSSGGGSRGSGGAPSGGSDGRGGSGGSQIGSGGSGGNTQQAGAGGASSSPAGGSGGTSTQTGACATEAKLTIGVHASFAVTWTATNSLSASSGTPMADILWLASYVVSGNELHGTEQTCKLSVPDATLTALGQIAAGGSKIQITIPSSVFAKAAMPRFDIADIISGWQPGDTFVSSNPPVVMLGLELPSSTDPATYKWPTSSWSFPSGTSFPDSDDDAKPGITSIPANGSGYVYPPVQIGLGGLAPAADEVYLASRTQIALDGKWTSCTELAGTTTVSHFDNHVVGCHVRGGSACTTGAANTQADFLDQNRTIYKPGTGTFQAKKLESNASCADLIAAFP